MKLDVHRSGGTHLRKLVVHGRGGTHLLFLGDFWGCRHSLRIAQINKHVYYFTGTQTQGAKRRPVLISFERLDRTRL